MEVVLPSENRLPDARDRAPSGVSTVARHGLGASPTAASLTLAWLVRLRWGGVVGQAATIAVATAWLGLELDQAANEKNGPLISTKASKVRAWVIPTNEEIMIARHTLMLVDRRR